MKKLILIGGAPGSGKTTYAKQLETKYDGMLWTCHLEADRFFMQDEKYQFDPSRLSTVHQHCQKCACDAMRLGTEMVIVSNCFTKEWEREFYLEEACRHGYEVKWVHMTGTYPNVHGVPEEKVQKMRDAFEPFTMNNYRKGYRITPYMLASYLVSNGREYPVRQLMCVFSEYQIFTECVHTTLLTAANAIMRRETDVEYTELFCRNFEKWRSQHGTNDWPIIDEPSLDAYIDHVLSEVTKSHGELNEFETFSISRGAPTD